MSFPNVKAANGRPTIGCLPFIGPARRNVFLPLFAVSRSLKSNWTFHRSNEFQARMVIIVPIVNCKIACLTVVIPRSPDNFLNLLITRTMRFAILSDLHANLEATEAVLADARKHDCTHFVCLGDVVGYNANPHECVDLVQEMECPVVKGNHDEQATPEPDRHAASMRWRKRRSIGPASI